MKTTRPSSLRWWPIHSAALLACAAMTLACWMLAIGPSLQQLHQRAKRLEDLSDRRHKSAKLSAALAQTRRRQTVAVAAVTSLGLRLDPANSANARMASITRLANACGLTVDEVRPGRTMGFPHYQSIALSLSGTGAYPAVARLLHRMHQDMPDTALESMDLTSDNGNVATPQVHFRLDFLWYAAPNQTAPEVAASGQAVE